jgi:hypothetical protein
MNDDQLYYFLVDKNTRNVLQIEYPSDIDEFNKILGTSEGKGNLLKDLGIILNSESRVFTNPEPIVKSAKIPDKTVEEIKTTCSDIAKTLEFKSEPEAMTVNASVEVEPKKKTTKKNSTKKIAIVGDGKPTSTVVAANLFAGLFD